MDSKLSKSRIIRVFDDEADLVAAADSIIKKATDRSKAQELATGLTAAMDLFENEKEADIVSQYDSLVNSYQQKLELEHPPILVALDAHAHELQRRLSQDFLDVCFGYQRRGNNPTNMELEQLFLMRTVLRRCGETIYQYENGCYRKLSQVDLRTLILKILRNEMSCSGQARQLKDVESLLLAEPEIEAEPMDLNPNYICLENGVLLLNSMVLLPHSPERFFTSKLMVRWDENAICPCFDQFLYTVTGGDPILYQRFLEAIGYALVPDNRAKRFLLLQGVGDSGKSVLGKLLSSFFDPLDVSGLDLFRFGERFALSSLVDKRLNVSMDLTDNALSEQAVSIIKQLTGQDLVQVEEKYKAPYSANISCKLVFGTNHSLRLNASDRAFMRRVLLLPFQYPIEKSQQNPNLRNILMTERSGIFRKVLHAYLAVINRGYVFSGDDLYNQQSIPQCGTKQYTIEQGITEFATLQCYEEPDSTISIENLYQSYLSFCMKNDHPYCDNKQQFSAKFQSIIRGIFPSVTHTKKRIDKKPQNVLVGINVYDICL